jgi:CoA:oxalate CoA-transferase
MTGWPANTGNMPLKGVTVIDFGQIYQGSYASLLMAKAGANVIKVEPPAGEPLRQRVPPGKTSTLSFAMLNANKRGITLNLKTARGKELLFALVDRADVLIENFGPGALDGLGVGWPVLHARNPRLIYATGTGYGISGPNRDNLAMDLTVQAASGVMSVTGDADGPPMRTGVTMADFLGGTHLYGGVLTALYERERSGLGRLVEIAMQEAVYFTLAGPLDIYHRTGRLPPRTGNLGGNTISPFGVYPARDGFVAIHTGTEQHWRNLLVAAGRQDLLDDPRFRTMHDRSRNKDETDAIVSAWTGSLTKEETAAAAQRYRIPCAPVRDVAEVMVDAHMHERGMLEWVEHPELGQVVMPTTPLRLHGTAVPPSAPSPRLGQHNDEIFGGMLGLTAEEIATLKRDGVV